MSRRVENNSQFEKRNERKRKKKKKPLFKKKEKSKLWLYFCMFFYCPNTEQIPVNPNILFLWHVP